MSDIEFRVDKAFSSAVEQQLDEQREIRRLVSRVDESLVALSDGMVDLSGQISATAGQADRGAATPEDLEQARQELADRIGRLSEQMEGVEARLGGGDAQEELIAGMSRTRADLLEALARLERNSAPVAEAVDETRREVVAALRRLSEVVDADRDEVWTAAVQRLDGVIDQLVRTGEQHQARNAEVLAELRGQADEALRRLQQHAAEVLEHSLEESSSTGQELLTQVERMATEVGGRSEDLAQRLSALVDSTRSVAPDLRRVTDDLADQLAALLRDQQQQASAAVQEVAAVRGATAQEVAEVVDGLGTHLDAVVADRFIAINSANERAAEALKEAAARLNDVSANAGDNLDALADRLQTRLEAVTIEQLGQLSLTVQDLTNRGEEALVGVADRTERAVNDTISELLQQQTSSSREVRAAVDALSGVANTLEPSITRALDELTEALIRRDIGDREEIEQAMAALAEASVAARDGVLGAVGRATARLAEVQAEGIGKLTAVTDDLGRLPETLSPSVLAAVEEMQHGVARAIAELREATQEATRQAGNGLDAAVTQARTELEERLAAAGDDVEGSWQRLVEAQSAGAAQLEGATATLAEVADRLEPTIGTALEEVQHRLLASAAEERARSEQALGSLATASVDAAAEVRQALTEARVEIDTLLSRADEVTDRRVNQLFEQASATMADQLTAHEQSLAQQASEMIEATARVTPTVDSLITRMQDEVATVATRILGDLQAPLDEAGRVAEAMQPALARIVDEFREALIDQVEQAQEHSQEAGRQLEEAAAAVGGVTEQLRPEVASIVEQLRANLLKEAAAERTRADASINMLRESVATSIGSLQEELATTRIAASGAATELGEATDRARTAIDDGLGRVREELAFAMRGHLDELSERLAGAGTENAAQAEALKAAAAQLAAGVDGVIERAGLSMQEAVTLVGQQMTEMSERLAERMGSGGEEITTRMTAKVEEATERVEQAATRQDRAGQDLVTIGSEVAESLQTSAGEVTRRLEEAQGQIEQAMAGLRTEVTQLVTSSTGEVTRSTEALTTTSSELSERSAELLQRMEQAFSSASGDITTAAQAAVRAMDERAQELSTQITGMGTIEQEAVTRLDALVADVTTRLSEELGRTREAVREATSEATAQETAAWSASGEELRTQVDRLIEDVSEQVGNLSEVLRRNGRSHDDRTEEVGAAVQQLGETFERRLGRLQEDLTASLAEREQTLQDLAQRLESRPVPGSPVELEGLVAGVRGALDDSLTQQGRHTDERLTELTETVERIRAELATAVTTASRAADRGLPADQPDISALLSAMEARLAEALSEVRTAPTVGSEEVVQAAVTQVAGAAEDRLQTVLSRLDGMLDRMDRAEDSRQQRLTQAEEALTRLQGGIRDDADAVLDALANRADEVLSGVSTQAEGLLDNLQSAERGLRSSLTDAFQRVQMDGLGRLDEATSRLIALGPKLERQTSGRVEDVVQRVVGSISDLTASLERVDRLDNRVEERVRNALADARSAVEAGLPDHGSQGVADAVGLLRDRFDALEDTVLRHTAELRGERSESDATLLGLADQLTILLQRQREALDAAERLAGRSGGSVLAGEPGSDTVCPDCGFVARTPTGLVAHRRTCPGRS